MKPENLGLSWGRFAAASVLLACAPGESVHAAADAPVMFVLDASSSMQNAADGKPKITHVRDLVAYVAARDAAKRPLGLVAFGAQDAQSCADVRTMVALGAKDPNAFRTALLSIAPKGVAPVGQALKAAVEAVAKTGKAGFVVLIADGADSCNQASLCAAARTMKATAPNVAVHAVGFVSTPSEKVESLSCVAEATGGRFTLVRGRQDLIRAVSAALAAEAKPAAVAAEAKPVARAAPLLLGALGPVSGKQRSAPQPVMAPDIEEPEAEVVEDAEPMAPEGPQPTLSLASPLSALAAPRSSPGKRKTPKISDVLAANANAGLLRQKSLLAPKLAPGATVPVSLVASAAEHMPPLKTGVVWHVFKSEKDASGAHPLVTKSEEAAPRLDLPPGEYIIHCSYGTAQATRRIQIGGAPLSEHLVLNAGALKLGAVVGEDRTIPEDLVSFAIYHGDPETTRENVLIMPFARSGQIIRLTEGSYHVVSHYGDANAMVRANVRVEAGKVTEAIVYHKAARVTLKLISEEGGEALANTSWAVMTPAGQTVRESVGAFPSYVLAAGEYTIVADHGGQKFGQTISVEAGQDKEITILAGPASLLPEVQSPAPAE